MMRGQDRKWPELQVKRLARRQEMAELYRAGKTLSEIGGLYGTTRENIRIHLKKLGVSANEGGKSVLCHERRAIALAKKTELYLRRYGCTVAEFKKLMAMGAPYRAFCAQKTCARQRGISWEFNISQWWTVWQKSGKWEQRGRKSGQYVMCRYDDVGPYAVGNVYIATCNENCSVPRSREELRSAA